MKSSVKNALSWLLRVLGVAVLGTGLAYFNYLWAALFVLAVFSMMVLTWKLRQQTFTRVLLAAASLVLLIVAVATGVLPEPSRPDSIAESRLLFADSWLETPAEYDQAAMDQGALFRKRDNWENQYYLAPLARIREWSDAKRTVNGAGIFVSQLLGAGHATETAERVLAKIEIVKAALAQVTEESVSELELFLNQSHEQIYELETEQEFDKVVGKFHEDYYEKNLDTVHGHLAALQLVLREAIQELAGQVVGVESILVARLDEDNNTLELDERFQFTVGKKILKSLDLRQLSQSRKVPRSDAKITANAEESGIYFREGSCGASLLEAKTFSKISDEYDVDQSVDRFCIANRTVVESQLGSLGRQSGPRLARFQAFWFSWPALSPTKIVAWVDLNAYGMSEPATYFVDVERQEGISRIELPQYSFFQSKPRLAESQEAGNDLLVPEKEITPKFLRQNSHVWIELLPTPLRTSIVKKHRDYLFPENLAMALLLALTGAAIGFVIAPK